MSINSENLRTRYYQVVLLMCAILYLCFKVDDVITDRITIVRL